MVLCNHKDLCVTETKIPICSYVGTISPGGNHWIQVHLVPERTVTAITTQGRPADWNQYVTSYEIKYSSDGVNFQQVGQVNSCFKTSRDEN